MLNIRSENSADMGAVRQIHELAFERTDEAHLVDRLRQLCPEALSLVADLDGQIVGHIMFTPTVIEGAGYPVTGMGLAPMAVLPDHQGLGVGSAMVEHGLQVLREDRCPFVVVLGHPDYYPRFGFVPASRQRVTCQWKEVPDEAFMITILDQEVGPILAGTAHYREEFGDTL